MLALLLILILGVFFLFALSSGLDAQSSSNAALPVTASASHEEFVGDMTFDEDFLDSQSTSSSLYLTGNDLIPELFESSNVDEPIGIEI